ncbi:MAG: electron transport complex subunit RsxG [Kangiellaceae bacterium]|nr:electron transport complex subunit RsxG [Kangiellaceae bacterium]
MSIENDYKTNIQQASFKNAFVLAVFALVSTGLIAITHLFTKDKIAEEVELSMIRQLNQIVAEENYNNSVYQDCLLVNDLALLGSKDDQKIYRMRMSSTINNNNTADYGLMLTTVAPDGYSGRIYIAVALSKTGNILGVNILAHRETPGLGDKIERKKSNWLNQFVGLSLSIVEEKNWRVKKDGGQFDALTGATITPRAVIKSVYNSLLYYQFKGDILFSQASNCEAINE